MVSSSLGSGVELLTAATATIKTSSNVSMLLKVNAGVEEIALRLCSTTVPFAADWVLATADVFKQMILHNGGQCKLLWEAYLQDLHRVPG